MWAVLTSRRSEQSHEFLAQRRAELLDAGDRRRVAVDERDVVADADRRELHARSTLDVLDDDLQMALQVFVTVGGERRFVHRRAIGDDDEDAARLGAGEQSTVRPDQRFAVDVLLEHLVVEKQPESDPRPAPGNVGALDDDVLEGVEPSGMFRIAARRPLAPGLAAVPVARGEAEDLAFHAAALEHLREDLDGQCGDEHRAAAHRTRVIDQQAHDRSRKR